MKTEIEKNRHDQLVCQAQKIIGQSDLTNQTSPAAKLALSSLPDYTSIESQASKEVSSALKKLDDLLLSKKADTMQYKRLRIHLKELVQFRNQAYNNALDTHKPDHTAPFVWKPD